MKFENVQSLFAHRRPTYEVVATAARDLGWPDTDPGEAAVAARIRVARKAVVNPAVRSLGPAPGLDEAVAACYLNYGARLVNAGDEADDLTETSGGATWARRQPPGTEVAVLDSSYVTYRIARADLPGGVRGCIITAGWWD